MRIHFTSDERPKRISKALKAALWERGYKIPYAQVQAATASMYGYRNWNDLLGQIGKAKPSSYDQEVGDDATDQRQSVFLERLTASLGIPRAVSAEVIVAVGPTSRKGRSVHEDQVSWPDIVARMARSLTRRKTALKPFIWKTCSGFSIKLGDRSYPDFILATSSDGQEVVCVLRPEDLEEKDWSKSHETHLGNVLQGAGLLIGEDDGANNPIEPLIQQTLERLKPEALTLLRAVPQFSTEAYRIALRIPADAAFRRLVEQFPMLGAEIESLAHDKSMDRSGKWMDLREEMIRSDDPLEQYLDIVGDFVEQTWPDLPPLDRDAAKRIVSAIGGLVVLEDLGLLPWHVAFLSFAPERCIPKTPEQLAACMLFTEDRTDLFKPYCRMSPWDFYQEFDKVLKGDWIAMRARVKAYKYGSSLATAHSSIGDIIGKKLALEVGLEPSKLEDNEASEEIAGSVIGHIMKDRGYLDFLKAYDQLYRPRISDDLPDNVYIETMFRRMSSSGLLPDNLRGRSAVEVIEQIGVKLVDLIDPEEGLMVDKSRFYTIRIKGIEFTGVLSGDGPYINAGADGFRIGGVALGDITEIWESPKEGKPGWYVCKYGPNQPRIQLKDFTAEDVAELADAFGINVYGRLLPLTKDRSFYKTPAWEALKVWVKRRPELALKYAVHDDYLPRWYQQANQSASGDH